MNVPKWKHLSLERNQTKSKYLNFIIKLLLPCIKPIQSGSMASCVHVEVIKEVAVNVLLILILILTLTGVDIWTRIMSEG